MNPDAAKELLDLIMLDDFIDRREMLDKWSKRWLATMHVEYVSDGPMRDVRIVLFAKDKLLKEIFNGLKADEVGVLGWSLDSTKLVCEMNCVLRRPRDG